MTVEAIHYIMYRCKLVVKTEKFQLYDWQKRCLDLWLQNACRGIISVATGAGKTILALAAIYRIIKREGNENVRVKIIVPKIFLARQWKRDIIKELAIPETDVGLYYGGIKNDPALPVMIYVLNSARYSISKHIISDLRMDKSIFLICDEVHHFGSGENAHVFDFVPHIPPDRYFSLGLSATPEAEHLEDVIVPAMGKIIFRYDIDEACHARITAPYDLFQIAVHFSELEADEYEAYSKQISRIESMLFHLHKGTNGPNDHNQMRWLNALIAEGGHAGHLAERLKILYLKRKKVLLLAASRVACGVELMRLFLPDQRVIMFTERIQTANALYEQLHTRYPNRISRYHSNMDAARKQLALDEYRSGRYSVLLCCRALDEGLNVPDTDVGVLISSGNSQRQRIQRIGRIVRKTKEGRPKRIYYLYVPNTVESTDILERDDFDVRAETGAIDLRFDAESGHILNPAYDRISEVVIRELLQGHASEGQLRNALRQLERGAVSADYRMSEDTCLRRLQNAGPGEREYLSAMLLMIRAAARLES